MWCWHKWGKWGLLIKDYRGSHHQVCRCEKCGAIKRRLAVSIHKAQLVDTTYVMDSLPDTKGE